MPSTKALILFFYHGTFLKMIRRFTAVEKTKIVNCYLKTKKYGEVRATFPTSRKPQNKTIRKMVSGILSEKCPQTRGGGVKVKHVLTPQKMRDIQRSLKKQPKMGAQERAHELQPPRTTLRRGIKQCGVRANQARIRLDLKAGTCDERLRCATHLLSKLRGRGNILHKLCFTDEKFFSSWRRTQCSQHGVLL
jgi:hypothetical protein